MQCEYLNNNYIKSLDLIKKIRDPISNLNYKVNGLKEIISEFRACNKSFDAWSFNQFKNMLPDSFKDNNDETVKKVDEWMDCFLKLPIEATVAMDNHGPALFSKMSLVDMISTFKKILSRNGQAAELIEVISRLLDDDMEGQDKINLIDLVNHFSYDEVILLARIAPRLNTKMKINRKIEILKTIVLGMPVILQKNEGNVGKFLFIDKQVMIGKGVYGYVYPQINNSDLIIKKSIDTIKSPKGNFTNEYEIGHTINHPNIRKIHSLYQKQYPDGFYRNYILMDKVNGNTIKTLSLQRVQFPQNTIRNLTEQLKSCCLCLFQNRIVWNDMNDENILIDENNDLKVIDFGAWRIEENPKTRAYWILLSSHEILDKIFKFSAMPFTHKEKQLFKIENEAYQIHSDEMNEMEITQSITEIFNEVIEDIEFIEG